jgi:3-isopropylmalate/(R)-2-methylmalate dehydratase small subunit
MSSLQTKSFGGPAIFLDRNDINTDEIIPAKYLTEISKQALAPYLLEDLKLEGFDPQSERLKKARVVISRANFGCGSSREHAPWAFDVNDIHMVIASSFARIFRQNMFNNGMLAIELSEEQIDSLFALADQPIEIQVDMEKEELSVTGSDTPLTIPFTLSEFDRTLVEYGGWVGYAEANY